MDSNWMFTISHYENYKPKKGGRIQVQNKRKKFFIQLALDTQKSTPNRAAPVMSTLIQKESEQAVRTWICWELLRRHYKMLRKTPKLEKVEAWESIQGKEAHMLGQFSSFPWHLFMVTTRKRTLWQKNLPSEPIWLCLQSADKFSVQTHSVSTRIHLLAPF